MPKHLVASAIATALLASTAGADSLPSAAKDTLHRYSAAFNRGDCAEVLRLLSPIYVLGLRERDGIAAFCGALGEMAAEEAIDTPGPLHSFRTHGPHTIAVFQNERVSRDRVRFLSFYVVHSSDNGHTWHVLDNGCDQEAWLKKIFPPYSHDLPLPQQRMLLPPYFTR